MCLSENLPHHSSSQLRTSTSCSAVCVPPPLCQITKKRPKSNKGRYQVSDTWSVSMVNSNKIYVGGGETPTACSYWQVLRKHQQKSLQWVVIALLRYPCGTGEKPRLDWNQAQKDIEREFWAFHVIWGYSYIDKAVTVSHWRKEYRSVCGMDFCARQKCNFSCNDPIWLNMDQTFLDIVSFHLSFVCACLRKDRWKVLQQLSEAARRHFVNRVTHSQSQCQHADQAGITVSPILAWMITCEDL